MQGLTLHTHRWRQGRTVVSRGDDMQMTHLRVWMRRIERSLRLARAQMQRQGHLLCGLQHVAAVYLFELERLAARRRAVGG